MQEIEKSYTPSKYEQNIYKKWEESGAFTPEINQDKTPFVISMPPPNATGTLHLGHASFITLQDIMIRRKRMQGYNTLWLPGTDHAAIATQSVVEKQLQKQGIEKPREELGREKLLEEIKKFVEQSKSTIKKQIKKMGASTDWTREKYTLDDGLNKAVNEMFKRMYKDGIIYQGDRIVNWDPKMETTVSDDEVEYKEEKAKFYYFQYGPVVIGTARPETKFLDKVIVVNPNDERYKHLHNKTFEVEWINGKIKATVIPDKSVDPKMGTGAMTITPAHSLVDFELAQKHNLTKEQIIDFKGKLTDVAGEFAGMKIEDARPKIVEKLKQKGLLVKIDENYIHNIAINSRGKGIIEPQIMKQWFVDVNKKAIDWKGKKRSIKEVMQDTVNSGMIKIVPERFEKIYFNWINNLRDWCISRQIWWGHQIPIWYKVSKEDKEKWEKQNDSSSYLLQSLNIKILEIQQSNKKPTEEGHWIQDPDTLDTWFSASLWTFSTLGWPEHTKDFQYFHPTNVLETGYDIIFFWVARMILASTYCLRTDGLPEEKCIPFKTVYLHGLIRDIRGMKMSKSNPETCIDPLDMINKYGTDAVRLSLIIGSTPGNDMRLYETKIAGYRNFINKIWNASRFALMNVNNPAIDTSDITTKIKTRADKWILSKLNNLIKEVNQDLEKYRFSDAATKIYDFSWGQYCDWYLEISKGEKLSPAVLLYVLKDILRLLHPFTPFVTETIWTSLKQEKLLIQESWPTIKEEFNFTKEFTEMELIHKIITAIRSIRAEKKVPASKKIKAIIYGDIFTEAIKDKREPIIRMARLSELHIETEGEKLEKSIWKFIDGVNIFIPQKDLFDEEEEIKRIAKEIKQTIEKIEKISQRLNQENFIKKAPKHIIEKEKNTLKNLEKTLQELQIKLNEIKL